MKYNYYLIDFDGCLADTLSIWMDSYQRIFKEFGKTPTEQEIAKYCMGDNKGQEALGINPNESMVFLDMVFEDVQANMKRVLLNEKVEKTIKDLFIAGKKTAIVSSSARSLISPVLEREKLHYFFEVIVDKDDVTFHKPHHEPLEKALSRLKGIKEQAIMIGDTQNDLEAANNFGIASCIYYPENNERFYTREHINSLKPDYLISDFSKLLSI